MFNVSESACSVLSDVLKNSDAPDGVVVRLIPAEGSLSLVMGQAETDDKTFHHDGKPVLAVDQNVAEAIDNTTLDVVTTQGRPELTLVPAEETP